MQSIPVDVEQLAFVALGTPRPKIANRQTGEIKMVRGQKVMLVPVAVLQADEANEDDGALVRIQVIGEPEGISRGVPLVITGMFARPYDFKDDRTGEQKFGITYWAESIAPVKVPDRGAA